MSQISNVSDFRERRIGIPIVDIAYLKQEITAPVQRPPTMQILLQRQAITSEVFRSLFYSKEIGKFGMITDSEEYGDFARYLYLVQMASQKYSPSNGEELGDEIPFNLTRTVIKYYEHGDVDRTGFAGLGETSCWSTCSKMNLVNELNEIKYVWGKNKALCLKPLCSKSWLEVQEDVAMQRYDPDGCISVEMRLTSQIVSENPDIPPVEVVFRYLVTDFVYDLDKSRKHGLFPNLDPTDKLTPDNRFSQQRTTLTFNSYADGDPNSATGSGLPDGASSPGLNCNTASNKDMYILRVSAAAHREMIRIKLSEDHDAEQSILGLTGVTGYTASTVTGTTLENAKKLTTALRDKLAINLAKTRLRDYLAFELPSAAADKGKIIIKSNQDCGPTGFNVELCQGLSSDWTETGELNAPIYQLTKRTAVPLSDKTSMTSKLGTQKFYTYGYSNYLDYECALPCAGELFIASNRVDKNDTNTYSILDSGKVFHIANTNQPTNDSEAGDAEAAALLEAEFTASEPGVSAPTGGGDADAAQHKFNYQLHLGVGNQKGGSHKTWFYDWKEDDARVNTKMNFIRVHADSEYSISLADSSTEQLNIS